MDLIITENYYTNKRNEINDIKFEYLNINQFDLVNLLYSDYLPVESENSLVGSIYFYCMKKNPKDIDNIMKGIRYEFVNFRILCTLARDHDVIKNSPTFRKEFKSEFKKRIKKLNDNQVDENNKNRINLRKNIKRNNFNFNNNDDGLSGMNVSDEIITFFLEKRNNEEYKDKLMSLKKELKEEKRITDERIKNLEKENIQLNLEKNKLMNENLNMKNNIFKNRMKSTQYNNENNNFNNANLNAFKEVDSYVKNNVDFNSCLSF